MRLSRFLAPACIIWAYAPAAAQSTNYASLEIAAGASARIGYYGFAKKDCTPEPLPSIEVVSAPKHGVLTVRTGTLNAKNIANCTNLKLPAQIVFYRAQAGYVGPDQVVFGVKNAEGAINVYSFSISVKESAAPQSPPPDNL
jgi:hypothetical protein